MVVAGDAELGLDYDGQSHKLRTGTGSVRLSWPAKPGAKISLNGQPLLSVDGAWALFRLLDKGQADPSATVTACASATSCQRRQGRCWNCAPAAPPSTLPSARDGRLRLPTE